MPVCQSMASGTAAPVRQVIQMRLFAGQRIFAKEANHLLKVAFIQKVLIHLSFPQTDEPHYFPELEFCICDTLKGSHHVK